MTAQEHFDYQIGWDAHQIGHSDINVCNSMLQRKGWLAARAAEEVIFMDDARAYAQKELEQELHRNVQHA